ncbi:hypothetical protein Ocin01_06822 [Orchesella cincta]|uniref:Transmembrane protein n=1 Tax=Orchesella cincta TaxID=48709 RepID=A0A1D2N3K7_ORCCI|nr:hypothetical protein Ocin01_06822 [Orchesella cincta]
MRPTRNTFMLEGPVQNMANSHGLMILLLLVTFVFTNGESVVRNESSDITNNSQSKCQTPLGPFYYQHPSLNWKQKNEDNTETDESMGKIDGDLSKSKFWSSGFGFSSHYETLPLPPPIPAELL